MARAHQQRLDVRTAASAHPSVRSTVLLASAVAIVAVIPYAAAPHNGLLNWDDGLALTQNRHLVEPGVIRWAFTSTHLEHYQPIAWLVWAAAARMSGVVPSAVHILSIAVHALNSVLIYFVTRRLIRKRGPRQAGIAGVIAATGYAVHPVHVETVAWASAFPLVLALAFLLFATLAYLQHVRTSGGQATSVWMAASCFCFALSILSRPFALAYPAVLLCVDAWMKRSSALSKLMLEKVGFVIIAFAGLAAEWHARSVAPLTQLGLPVRAALALETPYRYVWRLVVPTSLSPVYPLPVGTQASWLLPAAAATAAVFLACVWLTTRANGALLVVVSCLLLLSPSLLAPSGVQASADRYLYIPLVPIAVGAGVVSAAMLTTRRRLVLTIVSGVWLTLAVLTARQVTYWHDSVSLWSRAATLDPRNDIATYNLAAALAAAGRTDDAIAWYQRTLALVPDHAQARANATTLLVRRYEDEAVKNASSGQLQLAIGAYSDVLRLDPGNAQAHAGRGIAFARIEAWDAAAADLAAARAAGVLDPEVANSLALALVQSGSSGQAVAVLKDAIRTAPDDVTLAHNLARLLLDAADDSARDPKLALALAEEICYRTGYRNPQALQTLAAAYAANGRQDLARQTATRGVSIARRNEDPATAKALENLLADLRR
jgi:Flp pilus assembly protein TadD